MSKPLEEVVANLYTAMKSIKSGVLANTPANGNAISAYMLNNKLEPTVEDFQVAITAIAETLVWISKPAKLTKAEQNDKARNQLDAVKDQNAFAAKAKEAEAADKKAKADEQIIKETYAAIASYTPVTRDGRVAYGKQASVQELLKNYVVQETKAKTDATVIQQTVLAYIANQYAKDEKANERMP